MKSRTVIILWIIALVLGLSIVALKITQNRATTAATNRAPGETLVENFPSTEVSTIEIAGPERSTTLVKQGDQWTVAERDNFPADSRTINDLLRTLSELKVTQGIEAGPSFAPSFGMDETSTDPAERGVTTTFKGSEGKELARLTFGKNLESAAASASPFGGGATGRYVRNHNDESGFYAVSEVFGILSPDPKNWLADDFIRVEKIQSVSVTRPGSDEIEWTLVREDENGEFAFQNATEAETTDAAATAPLKSLFSFARFEDVVPAGQVAQRSTPEQLRKATIITFEGFTYQVSIQPAKATGEVPDADSPPPAADNYLFTFQVAAELPEIRKTAEDETDEDAKIHDEAFTERRKTLSERLETAKTLSDRTFLVSSTMVEPLLKDRASLVEAITPPPAPPGTTAFSQPIEIPAREPEAEPEEEPEAEPEAQIDEPPVPEQGTPGESPAELQQEIPEE
jgi:hypothetical protein